MFAPKAIRLMRELASRSPGAETVLNCTTRNQAEHYRSRFYALRNEIREHDRDHSLDPLTFHIEGSRLRIVHREPDPLDAALGELREDPQ